MSDFVQGCWCTASQDLGLQARCIRKGKCVFESPNAAAYAHLVKPKEVLVGVLTDYFAGMQFRELRTKWGISGGYVYKKLALARIPGRGREFAPRRKEERQAKQRRLIPYAGKE